MDLTEHQAAIKALLKDAERQHLTATFNALMNEGAGRQQFEDQAARIAAGLKRTRAEYAALLAEQPAPVDPAA